MKPGINKYVVFFSEISYVLEDVALDTFKSTHLVGLDNKNINLSSDDEIKQTDLFKQWCTQLQCNEGSYRLAIGAVIANKMRIAVKEKCGFTCSAGVGPNKVCSIMVVCHQV